MVSGDAANCAEATNTTDAASTSHAASTANAADSANTADSALGYVRVVQGRRVQISLAEFWQRIGRPRPR